MSTSTLTHKPATLDESVQAKVIDAYTQASIAYATAVPTRAVSSIRTKIDKGLVRYDAYTQASIAYATAVPTRAVSSIRTKIDKGLVRYDAWFLVFTAVVLGLGATTFAGLVVWCLVAQGKTFTGNWEFKDFGLKVRAECV